MKIFSIFDNILLNAKHKHLVSSAISCNDLDPDLKKVAYDFMYHMNAGVSKSAPIGSMKWFSQQKERMRILLDKAFKNGKPCNVCKQYYPEELLIKNVISGDGYDIEPEEVDTCVFCLKDRRTYKCDVCGRNVRPLEGFVIPNITNKIKHDSTVNEALLKLIEPYQKNIICADCLSHILDPYMQATPGAKLDDEFIVENRNRNLIYQSYAAEAKRILAKKPKKTYQGYDILRTCASLIHDVPSIDPKLVYNDGVRFYHHIKKFAEKALPSTIKELQSYWIDDKVQRNISEFLTHIAHAQSSHYEDSFGADVSNTLDISDHGSSVKFLWILIATDLGKVASPDDDKKIEKFIRDAFEDMKYLPFHTDKVRTVLENSTVFPIIKLDTYNSVDEAIEKGIIGAIRARVELKNLDVECNTAYTKVLLEYSIEKEPTQVTPELENIIRKYYIKPVEKKSA